MEVINFEDRIW